MYFEITKVLKKQSMTEFTLYRSNSNAPRGQILPTMDRLLPSIEHPACLAPDFMDTAAITNPFSTIRTSMKGQSHD